MNHIPGLNFSMIMMIIIAPACWCCCCRTTEIYSELFTYMLHPVSLGHAPPSEQHPQTGPDRHDTRSCAKTGQQQSFQNPLRLHAPYLICQILQPAGLKESPRPPHPREPLPHRKQAPCPTPQQIPRPPTKKKRTKLRPYRPYKRPQSAKAL